MPKSLISMEDQIVVPSHIEDQKATEVWEMLRQTTSVPSKRHFSCRTTCVFSRQAKHGLKNEERSKSTRKLLLAIFLCIIFTIVEIVGGVKANSLGVLTDAAHLLSDVAGFIISLFSIWASTWEATPHRSYGFSRVEVLGALLSIQLIWLTAGILVYEAINRILHTSTIAVDGKLMFIIATFGLFVNIIMAFCLGHDHHNHYGKEHRHVHDHDTSHEIEDTDHLTQEENTNFLHHVGTHGNHSTIEILSPSKGKTCENMNMEGAYLHVLGDLIQSIGMMIGGAVIWVKPHWLIVDLICTLCFSILVLRTTLSMMRSILDILMESTPVGIDVRRLETSLKKIDGVCAVHELHVWAITVGKTLLACHVIAEPDTDANVILFKIKDYCEEIYRITHVTVQIERE